MRVTVVPRSSPVAAAIAMAGAGYFPKTAMAIRVAADMVAKEWRSRALQAPGSKGGWKQRYAESVKQEDTGDPLSARVSATGLYVNLVEKGVEARVMNMDLVYGPMGRISESGERYNIIPIRHGVPGSRKNPMPESVYGAARTLAGSDPGSRLRVVGLGGPRQISVRMAAQMGRSAAKGLYDKRYSRKAERLGPEFGPRYGGMVRAGELGHSQYITFRIVTENGKPWIYPAVTGSPVFERLVAEVEQKVRAIVKEGLDEDLSSFFGRFEAKAGPQNG